MIRLGSDGSIGELANLLKQQISNVDHSLGNNAGPCRLLKHCPSISNVSDNCQVILFTHDLLLVLIFVSVATGGKSTPNKNKRNTMF